jgi:uncharacterized protein
MTLNPVQARVLGTLIEKEIVTPENYPLSLNALVAGCNQKSSRDPVMELGEEEVRQALHGLEEQGLTSVNRDARVAKFEHRARTVLNLRRDETAVLCLLLLRGPQTPGELRSRADRMYSFDDTAAVENTLNRLMASQAEEDSQARGLRPIVAALARQRGSREVRYGHLLSGPISDGSQTNGIDLPQPQWTQEVAGQGSKELLAQRVKELEGQMELLRAMMRKLEDRLASESVQNEASDDGTAE